MLVLNILAIFHLLKYVSSAIVIVKPIEGYNKNVQPNETVVLDFYFDVETIGEIDPNKQNIKMSIMLAIFWKDHRVNVTTIGAQDPVSSFLDSHFSIDLLKLI